MSAPTHHHLDDVRHLNVIDPVTFAGLIGRSSDAVYRMIRAGKLPVPVIRLGSRHYVIPVKPVIALLEGEAPAEVEQAAGR